MILTVDGKWKIIGTVHQTSFSTYIIGVFFIKYTQKTKSNDLKYLLPYTNWKMKNYLVGQKQLMSEHLTL